MMRIKRLTPRLNVSDIERSLDFYQQLAGFELVSPRETVDQWRWAWIKSGDGKLMLSESGGQATREDQIEPSRAEGWPAIYYFFPKNVVDLHVEAKRKECQVSDLRVTFYGMKEYAVRNPDGHSLRFGQETDESPTSEGQSR
jgi:uncharacterized glyoxalase superfamily protein PhnB